MKPYRAPRFTLFSYSVSLLLFSVDPGEMVPGNSFFFFLRGLIYGKLLALGCITVATGETEKCVHISLSEQRNPSGCS